MAITRQQMREQKRKARAKFDKINALSTMTKGDEGVAARQERKSMNQRWEHRDMRPGTMYKPSNAKPSACIVSKG